ncbi:MAG: hypothetical protein F4011_01120 [Acidimicrobiaceae bacterium]|nr:hypothetical protein [Acidimicrobiaceae bacterium]MYH00149.1 hypothetical protein [Acidimicrobiaceae bacterium]MYL02767.1 hypothetical protein [Acidimicrobiaceae bacterium]
MSFQGDERPRIYAVISRYGSNPFKIIEGTYHDLDFFLGRGNFRPLGRLFETAGHSLVFEAGEATGLAPHVVLGAVRLVMVGLLALTASAVVAALARSAGVSLRHPVNVYYPLALGTVLVASGSHGPDANRRWYNHVNLVHFPHTIIGAVVLILAVALLVARDRDMQRRRLRRHEWATMAALGGVSALFYDLVYLAPILAAVFIVARAVAMGMPLSEIRSTAAVKRWTAASAGFLVAFVPARIEIIRRCAEQSCYNGTDPQFSVETLGHIPRRLAAGTPLAGWSHNAELARHFGLDLGMEDLARNALTGLLLAAVLVMAVVAARSARPTGSRVEPHPGLDEAPLSPAHTGAVRPRHLALALAVLGASAALLAALLASLSNQVHETDLRAVDAWRETVLTQVGWSLLIAAGVVSAVETVRGRGPRQAVAAGAAGLLAVLLAASLLANWRLSQADRHDPLSSVTSQISNASVTIDWTEEGNRHRCALIDAYSGMIPEHLNMGGPAVRQHLDQLMLNRYSRPFCDTG